ncbi:hypothetical protein [Rufibacter latericius]|nr:hypothetical protein [Rufibacter latericius]
MRNRVGFFLFRNDYEKAADFASKVEIKPNQNTLELPSEYTYLSVGGGEVSIDNMDSGKAILFYTFRGSPDGLKGFLKTPKGVGIEEYKSISPYEIYEDIDLGNGWFYLSGD